MRVVPADSLVAFVIAAAVIIVVPGPRVLFIIGRSLALGRLGGLVSVLGGALGQVPLVFLVSFGVGTIVASSPPLFLAVRIAGSAYLVYLGVQAIRHRRRQASTDAATLPPASRWRQLGEGFVVGVTNPKTIAFFVAVLPQFVAPAAGSVQLQLLELGLVFVAMAVLSDAVWALVAAGARAWFGRSPRRIQTLTATGGAIIIVLGVALLFVGGH